MADSAFTVFTLGDTSTFYSMLNGVALVFQDPLYSSNAYMGLGIGVFLGALILTIMMIYQAALGRKMDITILILPLFVYIILVGPKVDVKLVDAYNIDTPRKVDNIPIGLALPLTIASSVSYVFASQMETTYSTPNSPRVLTDGFVSPLKTLHALRSINIGDANPYILDLVGKSYRSCIKNNPKFSEQEYNSSPDSYTYYTNFLREKSTGVVGINENGVEKTVSCSSMGDRIMTATQNFINGSGGAYSSSTFVSVMNNILNSENEDGVVRTLKNPSDVTTAFQKVANVSQESGMQFLENMILNQALASSSNCASEKAIQKQTESAKNGEQSYEASSQCLAWVQATEQQAEDNAAAASGMLSVLQNGQNILVIIAILFFPIIVLFIMFKGKTAFKSLVSYLIYIASVYLWLPMAIIINYYVFNKLSSAIRNFTISSNGTSSVKDVMMVSDYGAFYEAISNSLSLANGLISTLPVFCLMFFSGMSMAAASVMRRWNVGESKYYDNSIGATNVISPAPIASTRSMVASNGIQDPHFTSGGHAFDSTSSSMVSQSSSEIETLRRTKSQAIAEKNRLESAIKEEQGKTVSGSNITTNKTAMRGESNYNGKGDGYEIQTGHTKTTSFSMKQNGSNASQKVNENAIAVNRSNKAVAGLGFGSKASNSINDITVAGNPNNPSQATTITPNTSEISDRGINTKYLQLGTILTGGVSEKNSTKQNTTENSGDKAAFSQEQSSTVTGGSVRINNERKSIITKDGHSESNARSINATEAIANSHSSGSLSSLERKLEAVNEVIHTVDRKLNQAVSFATNTALDTTDIVSRLSRFDDIAPKLKVIPNTIREDQQQDWKNALKDASEKIARSQTFANIDNPSMKESLTIFIASMELGGKQATDAWEAMTGMKIPEMDINPQSLKAGQIDWDKMTVEDVKKQSEVINNLNLTNMVVKDISKFELPSQTNGELMGGMLRTNIGSRQERNMAMTYNALLKAGFSPSASRIMMAQIGRETSFDESKLFGTHHDPRKNELVNTGLVSWNGTRKKELDQYMSGLGLVESGSMGTALYKHNQATLDAQARFMYKEMSQGSTAYKAAFNILNSNASDTEKHNAVGDKYIVWARKDESFAKTGIANIQTFTKKTDQMLKAQNRYSHQTKQDVPHTVQPINQSVTNPDNFFGSNAKEVMKQKNTTESLREKFAKDSQNNTESFNQSVKAINRNLVVQKNSDGEVDLKGVTAQNLMSMGVKSQNNISSLLTAGSSYIKEFSRDYVHEQNKKGENTIAKLQPWTTIKNHGGRHVESVEIAAIKKSVHRVSIGSNLKESGEVKNQMVAVAYAQDMNRRSIVLNDNAEQLQKVRLQTIERTQEHIDAYKKEFGSNKDIEQAQKELDTAKSTPFNPSGGSNRSKGLTGDIINKKK